MHLLGYFPVTPPSAELRAWLAWLLEMRRDRNIRLIAKLQSLGLDITLEEVEKMGRTLTARPHFAQVLVREGLRERSCRMRSMCIWMNRRVGSCRGRKSRWRKRSERILRSGGVPSLAHPVRVAKNNWDKLAEYVEDLAGMGLRAIEVYHSDHSPENVSYYASLAERFNLGMTGGSDFHGANKPSISLGTGNRNNLHVPDALVENLKKLAALSYWWRNWWARADSNC